MFKRIATIVLASLPLAAPALADVMLDLRTANAPATTQPAANDSSVTVLAVPGHDFFTKFTAGGNTCEVSGSVQELANGQFHVKIKLDSRSGGLQNVSTTVNLKAGEALNLCGLQNGTSVRATTLTVRPTNR